MIGRYFMGFLCPQCGAPANDDAILCEYCGTRIGQPSQNSVNQPPAYQQSTYQQPTYQQPAYQQPAYQQPAYQQPTYQQPAYQQPTYQQPTYQQPTDQQPLLNIHVEPTYTAGHSARPPKSKLVAMLLAFFLGVYGIQKFYLNQPKKGLLYVLFFWTGIPYLLSLIEFVTILFSTDEAFEEKYNCKVE